MSENLLPKQRLPKSKKTKDWGIEVLKELEGLITISSVNGRTTREEKQIDYDLYNGILNKDDFEYVLKPYGIDSEYPANLQHYDIISPKINLLLGEEIKRPFNFSVVAKNAEAVTELEEKKKELLFMALQESITPSQEVDPETQMPKTPKQVVEYMNTNYKSIREIVGQQVLTYLKEEQRLQLKFNTGFLDALVGGEEIYYVGDVSGEPVNRTCNPLDIYVIADPDSPFIQDAMAVLEERWLTIPTILDTYWRRLEPREIDALETNQGRISNNSKDELNYTPDVIRIVKPEEISERSQGRYRNDRTGTIRVVHCEWVSMRKIGILHINGEEDSIVGEEFEIPEEATKTKEGYTWSIEDNTIELQWYWINEVWEMDRIGEDIYTDPQPKLNQRRNMDNPSKVKLGYIGYIYNSRNSISTSLIRRMKPFQYLYNIIYYRLELAIAKSKGKLALMDISQIPASEGWDVDKWMYYLDALGVMFINSQEEGKSGQPSQFNQFQSIDLTLGNYINTHVQLLQLIEEQIGQISGISRQRQGQVQSSELVGNTERAVTQSSHITETWFYYHNEVKRQVLEALIDVAKMCWINGKKINYILDDMSRVFFSIDGIEFDNTEYGTFVTNSSKDDRIKSTIEQLAHAAMQNQMINLSDIVSILQTESIQDTKRRLELSEEAVRKHQKELQSIQGEQQKEIQAKEFENKLILDDREDRRNIRDNETKLKIADKNSNIEPDSVEKEKLELQRKKIENDKQKNDNNLSFQKEALDKKLVIERARLNKPSKS